MTEGSGATAESQCGWSLIYDFHSIIIGIKNVSQIVIIVTSLKFS